MKQKAVTDIQQARAIIQTVGDLHQYHVSEMLRSLCWNRLNCENERKAQKVIENMEHEYVLNVANVLWVEKQDQIPQYIKNYCDEDGDN